VSPAKTAEPIEMPFGVHTCGGRSRNHISDGGVHIGTTLRILLNDPCVAVIWPYVVSVWTLVSVMKKTTNTAKEHVKVKRQTDLY